MSNRRKAHGKSVPPARRPDPCPDCNSEVEWIQLDKDLWSWWRGHDNTCPAWGAKADRLGLKDRHVLIAGPLDTIEEL